jgi:exonuclease III
MFCYSPQLLWWIRVSSCFLFIMSSANHRTWNLLNWNVRGLNTYDKCNAVRAKIKESSCNIICIQETKRASFDPSFVRQLAPKRFNKFALVPSQGASGGIFVGWNGSMFSGQVSHSSHFALSIDFTATINADHWKLIVVYGPC